MYVRRTTDRNRYLVTEDELEAIEREWADQYQYKLPTEEDYQRLFQMPLRVSLDRKITSSKGSLRSPLSAKPLPVRWVLGPWCKAHCKRIAGHPSCHDIAGEWLDWDSMPCVPGGKVACHSDEFVEWWGGHHSEDEEWLGCDCEIELLQDGRWRRIN